MKLSLNCKHDALEYKLKNGITVDVLRDENFQKMVRNNIEPELELRVERSGVRDLREMAVSESFDKIKDLPGVGDEQRLTQQNFDTQKKLARHRGRTSSKMNG